MITDIVIVVAAALLVGVYVSWRAGRIDRLHARVAFARAALDAALLRRSSVAFELASSGLLDPATSLLLAGAAHGARGAAQRGVVQGGVVQGGVVQGGVAKGSAAKGSAAKGGAALDGQPTDLAESDLTRALRAAFSQPDFRSSLSGKEGVDELLAEVEAAAHQVFLARKFYNDAVSETRAARRRPLARVLRLAGKAGTPEFFEMDDSLTAE
jgi:hypothetical protein